MDEEKIYKCSKCETSCFSVGVLFPEGCLYKNLDGDWEEVSNEYTFITKEIRQIALDVKSEWKKYIEGKHNLPQERFLNKLHELLKKILKKNRIKFPNLKPPECDWQHPTDMHF